MTFSVRTQKIDNADGFLACLPIPDSQTRSMRWLMTDTHVLAAHGRFMELLLLQTAPLETGMLTQEPDMLPTWFSTSAPPSPPPPTAGNAPAVLLLSPPPLGSTTGADLLRIHHENMAHDAKSPGTPS
jgi:hypothetical protein